ncbi:LysR substrate-binding domain-containing protein [Streptomyces sp. NPDC059743]|uniref:LysR substrate-binding domain-containing protein n=1 Tax=Streptomyces sp. NPDC059743 TaxID=3346928 RepID=UPI003649958B
MCSCPGHGRRSAPRARPRTPYTGHRAPFRVEREVTLDVADIGTAVHSIRAGLGIVFLSRFLVSDHTGLDVLEVADHELRWQLAVAIAANRRPSATTEAFLDLRRQRDPAPRELTNR